MQIDGEIFDFVKFKLIAVFYITKKRKMFIDFIKKTQIYCLKF